MTNHPDKGKKGGRCNVTTCQAPGAWWYNKSTRAYYCRSCAIRINSYPLTRAGSLRLFGVADLLEYEGPEK